MRKFNELKIFFNDLRSSSISNGYADLSAQDLNTLLESDLTVENLKLFEGEIKKIYRYWAKRTHPDKTNSVLSRSHGRTVGPEFIIMLNDKKDEMDAAIEILKTGSLSSSRQSMKACLHSHYGAEAVSEPVKETPYERRERLLPESKSEFRQRNKDQILDLLKKYQGFDGLAVSWSRSCETKINDYRNKPQTRAVNWSDFELELASGGAYFIHPGNIKKTTVHVADSDSADELIDELTNSIHCSRQREFVGIDALLSGQYQLLIMINKIPLYKKGPDDASFKMNPHVNLPAMMEELTCYPDQLLDVVRFSLAKAYDVKTRLRSQYELMQAQQTKYKKTNRLRRFFIKKNVTDKALQNAERRVGESTDYYEFLRGLFESIYLKRGELVLYQQQVDEILDNFTESDRDRLDERLDSMAQCFQELTEIMKQRLTDRRTSPTKVSKVLKSQAAKEYYELRGCRLETFLEKYHKETVVSKLNAIITAQAFLQSIPEASAESVLRDDVSVRSVITDSAAQHRGGGERKYAGGGERKSRQGTEDQKTNASHQGNRHRMFSDSNDDGLEGEDDISPPGPTK